MEDYKVIRILRHLNKKDLLNLNLFLNSPYFIKDKDKTLFIRELCDNLHLNPIDYKQIWNKTENKPFSQARLRKKLHASLITIENFLIHENLKNSKLQNAKNLIDEATVRNISELVKIGISNLEAGLKEHKELTFEYYSYRFFLLNVLINETEGFRRKVALKKNKDSSEYLLKADKILNEIFLSEKLRLIHLLNHDNYISNRNDKLTFVEKVYEFAKTTSRKGSKPNFYMQLITKIYTPIKFVIPHLLVVCYPNTCSLTSRVAVLWHGCG